jgi:hypothetical protein
MSRPETFQAARMFELNGPKRTKDNREGLLLWLQLRVFLLEALDTTLSIDKLLLTSVKRMAVGANVHTDFFHGRAGFKCVPTNTHHSGIGVKIRMDVGFHKIPLQIKVWVDSTNFRRVSSTLGQPNDPLGVQL